MLAAMDSATFESATATRNAALTLPSTTIVRPSTSDSGTPSRTVPRTIASGEPSAWRPPECLRSPPPMRSISRSPAQNVTDPANRPSATLLRPPSLSHASCTSSKATALMSTPLPKAMTSPSVRSPMLQRSATAPPTMRVEAARKPQPKEAATTPVAPQTSL